MYGILCVPTRCWGDHWHTSESWPERAREIQKLKFWIFFLIFVIAAEFLDFCAVCVYVWTCACAFVYVSMCASTCVCMRAILRNKSGYKWTWILRKNEEIRIFGFCWISRCRVCMYVRMFTCMYASRWRWLGDPWALRIIRMAEYGKFSKSAFLDSLRFWSPTSLRKLPPRSKRDTLKTRSDIIDARSAKASIFSFGAVPWWKQRGSYCISSLHLVYGCLQINGFSMYTYATTPYLWLMLIELRRSIVTQCHNFITKKYLAPITRADRRLQLLMRVLYLAIATHP